jgi:ribosome-associated translation inhibitor RaiA
MKCLSVICVGVLAATLLAPSGLAAHVRFHCDSSDGLFRDNDVSVEIEKGSIIFSHDDGDETVEITEDAELIVNGKRVNLDRRERELVEEYYATFNDIMNEAKSIGIQGAKVGVKGAAIGIKAALGVIMTLSADCDREDLEESLEKEGEKLERAAKKLEKRAKRLEKRVESLERLHGKLRREVDELDELGWF